MMTIKAQVEVPGVTGGGKQGGGGTGILGMAQKSFG